MKFPVFQLVPNSSYATEQHCKDPSSTFFAPSQQPFKIPPKHSLLQAEQSHSPLSAFSIKHTPVPWSSSWLITGLALLHACLSHTGEPSTAAVSHRGLPSTCLWLSASCSSWACWPSLQQGHNADPCSTCCLPEPQVFSAKLLSRQSTHSVYCCMDLFLCKCRIWHLPFFSFMR